MVSPQLPGLMLALDRGGRCEGIVHRLPDEDDIGQIGRLLRREIGSKEALVASVGLQRKLQVARFSP